MVIHWTISNKRAIALVFAVKGVDSAKEYKFTAYLNYALKHVIRGLLACGSDILNQSSTMSLDQPIAEDKDGGELLLCDTIQDERAAAMLKEIERRGEFEPLYQAVDSLPEEQRTVICAYYFKGLTDCQIDELHRYKSGQSKSIRNKALRTLRNDTRLQQIYSADYSYCGCVRHKGRATAFTNLLY